MTAGIKRILSSEEMEIFKRMANDGTTKQAIANALNIDRSTVDRILKQFGIELKKTKENQKGKKLVLTDLQIEKLKDMYSDQNFSLKDIAEYFQCSIGTINKVAIQMGLKKERYYKSVLTKEDEDFIIEAINNHISIKEISQKIKHCDEIVKKFISEKNLLYPGQYYYENEDKKITKDLSKALQNKDFEKAIKNPAYSNAYLSRKYYHAPGTIARWRKILFGNYKRMVDTYLCKSTSEMDFEDILLSLKLSYLYEQKIGKWKVDYDLGFKFLVEIQGSHWHDEVQKTMEKDIVKIEDLTNKGYTVLTIWDYELKNPKQIKDKILHYLKISIEQYYRSLNLTNLVEVK